MEKHLLTLFCLLSLSLTSLFAQLPGSGNSLDFSGSRYVNITNNTALNPTGSITIEAWIKADTWRSLSWQGTIVGKDGWASGEQGYALRCGANGTLSFILGRGPNWEELVSASGAMQANKWYHVAGTWDGSTQRVYVNGIQVGSRSFTGTISSGTYDVRIGMGAYAPGGLRDFDGQIDEVRIWNKAITQTNLRTFMCQRLNSNHPQDSALVAYYQFDETTGTTAADSSGNSLNGTLVGSPTRQTSGAAIGDLSAYSYGSSPQLVIPGGNGDTIRIQTASGSPTGLQFYYVGQKPNVATPPASITKLDTTQYTGVFPVGGTNPTYNMTYHYDGNPVVPASVACKLKMANRTDNASTSWAASNATLNLNNKTIRITGQTRKEFILGFGGGLAVNNLGQARFCEGDTASLQVAGASNSNYQWLSSGTAIPGATDSVFHALQSGVYAVTVSTSGCNDTSRTTSITVDPAPVVSITYPPSVCEDAGLVGLIGSPIGGTFSGTWINGRNFRSTAAGPGVHTFNYTFTDTIGCSKTQTDSITVLPSPTVNFNTSLNVFCQSDAAVALSGGTPAGGTYSGPGVSGTMFDPGNAGVGSHSILYTYTNAAGCSQTANQTLQVQGAPNVGFGSVPSVCIDQPTYQLTTGSPAGGLYKGNGMTSIAFFSPMVAGVGTHQITYVYTNGAGCTDSASQTIVVNDLPVVTMAPFDTFCADHGPITLANGMPAGGVYSGPAVTNGVFNLSLAGTFPISYRYVDPQTGCAAIANQNLRLFPVPPKPTVKTWGALLISSAKTGNQWYNSSDLLIPWAIKDTFEARGNGSYYVIVTNEYGCVSQRSDLYDVNNVNIEQDLSLGEIAIFPNPNNGLFNLQFGEQHQETYRVVVHNLLGQIIMEETFSPHSVNDRLMPISLPEQVSGVLFLSVESRVGRMSWKIWVE